MFRPRLVPGLHRNLFRAVVSVSFFVGSIFFTLSALDAYSLPNTRMVNIAWANAGTFLGAVCFFLSAYMLLPERRSETSAST